MLCYKRHWEQQWISIHPPGGLQRPAPWIQGQKNLTFFHRKTYFHNIIFFNQMLSQNINIMIRFVCSTTLERSLQSQWQAQGFSCEWTFQCSPLEWWRYLQNNVTAASAACILYNADTQVWEHRRLCCHDKGPRKEIPCNKGFETELTQIRITKG